MTKLQILMTVEVDRDDHAEVSAKELVQAALLDSPYGIEIKAFRVVTSN